MPWTAHIDGGSRGNPGPAAAGVVLHDASGANVLSAGFFLGRATNNQAEYQGLLKAVELLARAKAREAEIVSDSELMVRQINGQYKVRSPELRPLYEEAMAGLASFKWRIRHVLRERNARADGLANEAMDATGDVVQIDALGLLGPPIAPGRPSESTAAPIGRIEGRISDPPMPGRCEAAMRAGQSFQFGATGPAGLCLYLCPDAAAAVLKMREQDRAGAVRVKCGKAGCGAILELRRSE